ncbi:Complete genome; segment 7/17 (fragment) [Crenothrix polyspora]|uniref:Complete genome segment 7/17 n=1 Tax=Crenothrix polyspora TaxID=360316 RepID=A0A1R4H4H7_9GAMM
MGQFSKLPVRQLTLSALMSAITAVSKLPVRQLTSGHYFSD